MTRHPYADLPNDRFWARDPGVTSPTLFDPVTPGAVRVKPGALVATAGSCFAEHMTRALPQLGLTHLVTELAPPVVPADVAQTFQYGRFSARYGAVYTPRQLLQLVQRAQGTFTPRATGWALPRTDTRTGANLGAGLADPFRPMVHPGGYISEAELIADREQHLRAVARMLRQMEVFVFTLGLTEAWADPVDGAVFPLAPGVAAGSADDGLAEFVNFDADEARADLIQALTLIRQVNPTVQIILTVSPVALRATYAPRHVAQSTIWSKSVLRIAAEAAAQSLPQVMYFPSYEVITAPQTRGMYFAPDARDVTAEGVAHVMRLFARHVMDTDHTPQEDVPQNSALPSSHTQQVAARLNAMCEESTLDPAALSPAAKPARQGWRRFWRGD